MNKSIRCRCPAKINLYLDVGERREDGFHEVTTVIQSIDIFDELSIEERAENRISMECSLPGLPADRNNLCWKAAELVRDLTGCGKGLHLALKKGIPVAAGLGGGSSDAAGVLLLLNRLWKLGLSTRRLEEMGARLGSDVPFFIRAGTALCTGRGEEITAIENAPSLAYILIKPAITASTAAVYESMSCGSLPPHPSVDEFIALLRSGDSSRIAKRLWNRLESGDSPHLIEVKRVMKLLGRSDLLGCRMSGSGPSVFAIARDLETAHSVEEELKITAENGLFLHSGITNNQ